MEDSKERIDLTTARALLLANVELGEGFRERLRELAEALPVSEDRDAMLDDVLPCDAAAFMFGAVDDTVRETLPTLLEGLRRAATVTDEELARDFFERHGRYLAEQKQRLGSGVLRRWPELHQRLLDLAQALRAHGILWRPFADRIAEAHDRGSRVPEEVAASLIGLLKEALAIGRGKPTAGDCEWFRRRFRELWGPLRMPGEVWAVIDPEAELVGQALRGRRIPSELMAEMESLLAELRTAFRAKTTPEELASFVRRCRERARSELCHLFLPDRAADFDALAERSERERTAYWEEYELLFCDPSQAAPVWGSSFILVPGEQGGVELRTFLRDPEMAEVFQHRSEPTVDTYMSLWRLVAACESGFGGLREIETETVSAGGP